MKAEERTSYWQRIRTGFNNFAFWLARQDRLCLERVSEGWVTNKFSRSLIAATYFGDGYLWALAGLGLILFGGSQGRNYVLVSLSVSIVNIAVFRLLKTVMGRPRPIPLNRRSLKYRVVDNFAFPSGHATVAFGISFATVYFYSNLWWAWFAAYLASLTISISRIFVREHYPSDVIGGAIIGTLVAAVLVPFFAGIVF